MSELATLLPARRTELVIKPLGDEGRYVVKDPRTGEFFHLGEVEHFLLTQLDGQRTAETLCAAYAERFDEPLSEDDLDEFIELARSQGFLREENPLTPDLSPPFAGERGEAPASLSPCGGRGVGGEGAVSARGPAAGRASSTGARVSGTPTAFSPG
jgi:Coenzyme PQQ synthesis protein D (PqqD)